MSTDADKGAGASGGAADRTGGGAGGGAGTGGRSEQDGPQRTRTRGSWTVPITAAAIGTAFLVIYLGHHDVAMAVFGLTLMLAYAAVLIFGSRRSETVALLRGETTDERRRSIEQRAAALTLYVLTLVLVGGYLVTLIRGKESATLAGLCALLGATYLVSTVVLTRRG